MIKELTEIRNELLTGLEKRDRLYIKMQINKIDTLLYNVSKNNCVLPVVIERDLLEKTSGELTEYALALNGDVCMPNEATEMMSSKHRVLNLVKRLNHAL